MFFKKATKIDEIFTVNLTVTTLCQIDGEDLSIFLDFLEKINFNKSKIPTLETIIFAFKMMVKSGLENFILKSHEPLQSCC